MIGVIYKYTNRVNGKVYVGQTTNPEKRYIQHRNTYEDSYFHRAIKKYGFENFEYEILATVITSDTDRDFISSTLDYLEITYIQIYDSFNNGYNLTIGGGGSRKYYTDEDRKKAINETKKKYREAHKEEIKKYREEHKEEKNEHSRKYRKANKKKLNEYQRNYYEEHKEEKREYRKNYRKANREKFNERQRKYREKLKQKKIENIL